jgi:hypothetical protein
MAFSNYNIQLQQLTFLARRKLHRNSTIGTPTIRSQLTGADAIETTQKGEQRINFKFWLQFGTLNMLAVVLQKDLEQSEPE